MALSALVLLAVSAARAEEPDLSWIDRQAVASGMVFLLTERAERPQIVLIKLAIDVAAPPQAIWDVLRACQIAPEYVPNVQSCRRLEVLDNGRAELFVQVIKPIFFVPAFEHVFRLDYTPYTRIDVHRVSGPIAHMDGTWWLLPQPGGHTLLVYDLALDPGFPIPRFLVRATLRRDLPKVMQAVRARAEAAGRAPP
ncbi:MAG TPA: SRPBCC family protein [Gammaproteobacteria bacterium]|nr:SRPBCC family protein [Gammaproteobacteria bacterium]